MVHGEANPLIAKDGGDRYVALPEMRPMLPANYARP
jgi:hypothetical protein